MNTESERDMPGQAGAASGFDPDALMPDEPDERAARRVASILSEWEQSDELALSCARRILKELRREFRETR